jgi:hypothetical protein
MIAQPVQQLGYGLENQGIRDKFSAETNNVSLLCSAHTGSGAQPMDTGAPYTMPSSQTASIDTVLYAMEVTVFCV